MIQALRQRWPDVVDAVDDVDGGYGVTGVIISRAFNGLDHDVRQKRLWSVLNKALTSGELEQIGPIATLTPAEANVKISLPPRGV